jgi:hypothetical protein
VATTGGHTYTGGSDDRRIGCVGRAAPLDPAKEADDITRANPTQSTAGSDLAGRIEELARVDDLFEAVSGGRAHRARLRGAGVATGVCSDKEIGESLFISKKTVSVHVSNVLRKLAVANRYEAGRIGQLHGLGAPTG